MIDRVLKSSLCLSEDGDNRVAESSGAQLPFSRLWSVSRDIVSNLLASGNVPLLMNRQESLELFE
jgi:hypothetical protein